MPPALSGGRLDHTYVTSDDAFGPWGCFGRSAGGHSVSSAQGSSACADCLSKPSNLLATPPLYAGLRYGVTGVCHQAANRILRPAGITVAGVLGYGASVFLYGPYGRGGWPEWRQCVNLTSGTTGSSSQGVPGVASQIRPRNFPNELKRSTPPIRRLSIQRSKRTWRSARGRCSRCSAFSWATSTIRRK